MTLPPEELPVETRVLDISEEEKVCKVTGQLLVKIGEEVNHKLAYKSGNYFIKQIIRTKYALPQNSEGGIVTAFLPESLLTHCQADESFLADILTRKFNDHLPLYRISEILGQIGLRISRQTLSSWVLCCGQALKPLYEEMARQVLSSGNVFVDETPIAMLEPGKGKTHTAFMWVIAGGKAADSPYRVYNFRTDRQHHNALKLLNGYQGVLHSDKYGTMKS